MILPIRDRSNLQLSYPFYTSGCVHRGSTFNYTRLIATWHQRGGGGGAKAMVTGALANAVFLVPMALHSLTN